MNKPNPRNERQSNCKGILASSSAAIAAQEARKKAIAGVIKYNPPKKARAKPISRRDLHAAVIGALEDVARELRFKAKQTPGWAAAYHSACAVIEKSQNQWSK